MDQLTYISDLLLENTSDAESIITSVIEDKTNAKAYDALVKTLDDLFSSGSISAEENDGIRNIIWETENPLAWRRSIKKFFAGHNDWLINKEFYYLFDVLYTRRHRNTAIKALETFDSQGEIPKKLLPEIENYIFNVQLVL